MRKYLRKRIITINLSIILASLISILIAAYPVYLTKMFTNNEIIIVLFSFFIDAIIDFFIFFIFHLTFHVHLKNEKNFFNYFLKDTGKIQIQRIFLSIFFFIFSVGGHYSLLMFGFERTISFIISYLFALVLTRIIHTIYGIKTGLFKKFTN